MGSNSRTGIDRVQQPLFGNAEPILLELRSVVGRKWHPIIVYHLLEEGALGFSDLKSRIDGISAKMLSESLDDLEAASLVTRTVISDKPVRVEYSLTACGESLSPVIGEMLRWGDEHLAPETEDEMSSTRADPPQATVAAGDTAGRLSWDRHDD